MVNGYFQLASVPKIEPMRIMLSFLVEAPIAVLPWCPILGFFTHGSYEVWGLPSHGNGPTFSHQLNLLPLPSNVPAQGLPGMLHYGNWGTFSPTSENSSRANPLVPSMMGLSCLFLAEYQVCSQSLYQSFLTMGLVLLVLCPHMATSGYL